MRVKSYRPNISSDIQILTGSRHTNQCSRRMQMFLRCFSIAFFSMIFAGCTNQPAATTPSGKTVFAVLTAGGGWVNVGPTNGAFEILPGSLPSGGFQVGFDTIYPAKLRVSIDGVDLPKFDEI